MKLLEIFIRRIFPPLVVTIFPVFLFSQNEVCFDIETNPYQNEPGFIYFTKYVNVLDCFDIFAPSNISDEKHPNQDIIPNMLTLTCKQLYQDFKFRGDSMISGKTEIHI